MDSDSPSPTQDNHEKKAEFRKLTNDATNRKYRRRSPVGGSSDEDGSPKHDHGSRGNSKFSDHDRRNEDGVDGKYSSRGRHGRSTDSYGHSSRSHRNRDDDYSRGRKHTDEDDRSQAKSSSRSGRESRGGERSDYRDGRGDYNRSRDQYSRDRSDAADRKYKDKDLSSDRTGCDERHVSRYDDRDRCVGNRDEREEMRDHRSSRDHRSDRMVSDSRGHRNDSTLEREGDSKDSDGSKYSEEVKSKTDVTARHRHGGAERSSFESENLAAKRPKFSLVESDARKDERQTTDSKQGEELVGKDTTVDAAKVAALRAAELVNQNLTSTGFMTTDQKKKLLWGNKKNNNTEESSHRWDTALFSDREKQEKFHKLMGVKGDVKVDSRSPSGQDAEKQKELQMDLEKQYTAGLRRRDGRTVGLGL